MSFSEAIEGVSRLLLSLQYKQRTDDALVMQGRLFLESSLNTYVLAILGGNDVDKI